MKQATRVMAIVSSLAILIYSTSPALADSNNGEAVKTALIGIAPTLDTGGVPLLSELSNLTKSDYGYQSMAIGAQATVSIPDNPSNPIKVNAGDTGSVSVTLPFATQALAARLITDGAVIYDNKNSSVSSVVARNDGSVQFASILQNSDAPTDYSYEFGLPKGSRVVLSENGTVAILGANGNYLGGIARAWATDSRGASVPTHFEVAGKRLIQVVDHKRLPYSYPIVADPWLGFDMIGSTTWTSPSPYSPTLSIYPTPWGRAVAASTTFPLGSGAVAVIDQLSLNAAWSETLSKTTRTGRPNPDTPTMFVQFECHYFWVSKKIPIKANWNLDSRRPYAGMLTQFQQDCNVN